MTHPCALQARRDPKGSLIEVNRGVAQKIAARHASRSRQSFVLEKCAVQTMLVCSMKNTVSYFYNIKAGKKIVAHFLHTSLAEAQKQATVYQGKRKTPWLAEAGDVRAAFPNCYTGFEEDMKAGQIGCCGSAGDGTLSCLFNY